MKELFIRNKIKEEYHIQDMGNTRAFTCPNCNGFSSHSWTWSLKHVEDKDYYNNEYTNIVILAICQACLKPSIWLKNLYGYSSEEENFEKMLFPRKQLEVEDPNTDMPKDIKELYLEASLVLNESPRSSAALSRLAIDQLTIELGAEGKTLNNRIGYLVSKGLPIQIQQALDAIRVVGNNAVHPGQIEIKDNKELAISLLKFINIIVDNQISQPKLIQQAYSSLPKKALEWIEDRDKTT